MIQSEKLLQQKCTLTIVTNPVSAICTINYNGIDYTTKSLSVPSGTTVSYSIYHETYGTQTGTITLDTNKTINANGTYSTTSTDIAWTRPNLTANGTVGGSSFACEASGSWYTYYPWKAFDGKKDQQGWIPVPGPSSPAGQWITAYSPTAIKVNTLTVTNRNAYSVKTGTIYGSDTNSSWVTLKTFSNTVTAAKKSWTISVNATKYYKYIKFYIATGVYASSAPTGLDEIEITATKEKISYTYYWDITIL